MLSNELREKIEDIILNYSEYQIYTMSGVDFNYTPIPIPTDLTTSANDILAAVAKTLTSDEVVKAVCSGRWDEGAAGYSWDTAVGMQSTAAFYIADYANRTIRSSLTAAGITEGG